MNKIRKILIANRGEIAVRIINAARELNILTVCVYSQVDRTALHVRKADEAYLISSEKSEPYLDIDELLNVAKASNSDAVHPGYGFLSENPEFARRVCEEGLIFIGPSHQVIEMMGDKVRAKQIAQVAEVPVVAGFEVKHDLDLDELEQAERLGFPLLIKASAGGGGKGMRIVYNTNQLHESIPLAVREAKEAFGDGTVFLEKFIDKPRHIEFQVLVDHHENMVHLFERECSIQRRHQKVIEEAPSYLLDEGLRATMGEAALRIVKHCKYTNAGTIEFILDEDKNYYFLEMNTRLQVEHPVTEYITGLDLVKLQISIAEGEELPFDAADLTIKGHSIELRVYAEDPRNSFLPDIGTLRKYLVPKGAGIRVDDGYMSGMEIPVEYDPLIAKLVVHGKDRGEALAIMKRAIRDFEIDGVQNTLEFGNWVMESEDFSSGNFNTNFIEEKIADFCVEASDETSSMVAAIACITFLEELAIPKRNNKPILQSRWRRRLN